MRFNPVSTIAKKRDGQALTSAEIGEFVRGFTAGAVPDYQMSALTMAIYLRGMDSRETATLTQAMLDSGTRLTWPAGSPRVDKHSTGGIGDKVSLVLTPLLACCGLRVPMISGRGLGPTGGTLDKLESISGFRTNLSLTEIRDITDRVGCVITGASDEIAPADRKLYALRDVTATVASIPLITASIMSKKLAEGLEALVLDVKVGSGAFMKTIEQARELARSMVETGERMGVRTTALLTNMNQPLGRMAGNAIEVDESIAALQGSGPQDFVELTRQLGAELLFATRRSKSREAGVAELQRHIDSGAGLRKLREMVAAQGGNLDAPRTVAPGQPILAQRSGFISAINVEALGYAVIDLGGGRRVLTDKIDHSVGLEVHVHLGAAVKAGQPLVSVFAPPQKAAPLAETIRSSFVIADDPPAAQSLILERIAGSEPA